MRYVWVAIVPIIILFLTACQAPKENELINRIDTSTKLGLSYLESAYHDYTYDDQYLTFVYQGEDLACPLATPCNITYRLLDAYFDVYFLEEAIPNLKGLEKQRQDAHAVIEGIAKRWEKEHINNVIKSENEPGGVALDTYCIVGFMTKDKALAEVARSYLTEDDDWMPSDYYTVDSWRNIADESWCVRHFIAVNLDKELEARLTRKLIDDTNAYIKEENITDIDKLSVVYHAIYVLNDFEAAYKDTRFQKDKLIYADFISYFSFKKLTGNNLMAANLLDVMVASHYDNPDALKELSTTVANAQEKEGYWKISNDSAPDNGQIFTTFRALIGLNQYKKTLQ